jgi:hypothetical protein
VTNSSMRLVKPSVTSRINLMLKRMILSSTSSVLNVKKITTELPKVRFRHKNVNLQKSVKSSHELKKIKSLLPVK